MPYPKNLCFDEIVFSDDFLRCSTNFLHGHSENRRFLRAAFENPARRLGLRCRELSATAEGGALDAPAMMRTLGLVPSAEGWARSCVSDFTALQDEGLLPSLGRETLVIGWGMPPAQLGWLDGSGISFIDVEVAPQRFATHLALQMRTNDRHIEAMLQACRIDDEAFWDEATSIRAFFGRHGGRHLLDPDLSVGLFCGQCAIDLAVVCDGRVARPVEALEAARVLASKVDLLVIKPHPYEPDLRLLQEFAAGVPNAVWTDANIYALLSADNLRFVTGMTSGAMREAKFFLKEGLPLMKPDRDNPRHLPASCSNWVVVGPEVLSLAALSAACGVDAVPLRIESHVPPDSLDRAFRVRWGLDAGSPGLPPVRTALPNKGGPLHDGPAAPAWLGFGWSAGEAGGKWTVGTYAQLLVPLPSEASTALRITVAGHAFEGDGRRKPQVRIRVGDETHLVRGVRGRWTFMLPPAPTRKFLVVDFDIATPRSMRECGLGEDERLLGFHLDRLRIDHTETLEQRHRLRPALLGLAAVGLLSLALIAAEWSHRDGKQALAQAPRAVQATPMEEKAGVDIRTLFKRHDI